MFGSSSALGSWLRMELILARVSCATSLSFSSRRNSTVTVETPSREKEYICLTPAIELIASSIFLDTSRSTLSGEAPGNLVTIETTGISTFGHISTESQRKEKIPRVTSASTMTEAKTGRLMERSERIMNQLPCFRPATIRRSPSLTLKPPRST